MFVVTRRTEERMRDKELEQLRKKRELNRDKEVEKKQKKNFRSRKEKALDEEKCENEPGRSGGGE